MTVETSLDRDTAIEASRKNLNFLAMLCIPEIFKFKYPPMLLAVWQMITSAVLEGTTYAKLAIGLPRGFAKTVFLKIFVVWCILFSGRKFILVICNTASLAENFIADVVTILNSFNILRIFGDWRLGLTKDTQELKKFTFKGRDITLAALGTGSSLRGLNIKFVRPDLIIMDDMQSKEEAESPVESEKILTWMLATLLKARDYTRCLVIFVGNMYACEGSILRKLKVDATWISFITGGILEDGESLWPEFRSVSSLLEELESDMAMGHPEIFFAEVMNDPEAGSKSNVDFTKINMWKVDPKVPQYHEGGFVIIDPSAGKKKSNDVAIGVFLIFDGEPVFWEVKVGKFDPLAQCRESILLAAKYKLPAIIVEDVAYQSTLIFWMKQVLLQLGMGLEAIRILPINPQFTLKNSRIIEGLKQLTAQPKEGAVIKGRIFLHPEVRSSVTHQIVYWNPLKRDNKDDILDLMGYAYRVINTYHTLLLSVIDADLGNGAKAVFGADLADEMAF